jgi:hypothetical protein
MQTLIVKATTLINDSKVKMKAAAEGGSSAAAQCEAEVQRHCEG